MTDGTFPEDSAKGRIARLEEALSKAAPLDELRHSLKEAAKAAEKWAAVRKEQDLRESIAEALTPLKDLRRLVAAGTARSINSLSERITDILQRIHLRERFACQRTALVRRTVRVDGSFEPDMQIDATLVASTSWLRAILWAFVLALREEAIERLGSNPFPLMVLDDPQASFDPRNKRKWAEELVRIANMDTGESRGIQLFLTTCEREFYQCMVDIERLRCEQGLIGGVNGSSRVTTIGNAGWLQRAWKEAGENNDDARARDYIAKVRIYCEDLLKFVLRGEGTDIPNLNLGSLRHRLRGLQHNHAAPFDRGAFTNLLNTLCGGGGKAMKLLNTVHHREDETIGVVQAKTVKTFWEAALMKQIHTAFEVCDQFESFNGEPRTFPRAETIIQFPNGSREDLRALAMHKSGIAAAAKTDGRAGDGIVTVEEWETAPEIKLHNHGICQLAAGTLDPVAAIGDPVIVSHCAKVNPRNLVVAAHGDALAARRCNKVDAHPDIAVLTGQSVDPCSLPEPLVIDPGSAEVRKIAGTVFATHSLPAPTSDVNTEIVPLENSLSPRRMLDEARLFEVQGRRAEPIALDGQFLMTREAAATIESVRALDGRPVVIVDEDGTRYFKRLRCRGDFAMLESLDHDGTTARELLRFNRATGLPRVAQALEVIGVLFELPQSRATVQIARARSSRSAARRELGTEIARQGVDRASRTRTG